MTTPSMRVPSIPLPARADERLQDRLILGCLAGAGVVTLVWWVTLAYGLWTAVVQAAG